MSATGDTPAAHADPSLPVESLRDAIPHLRRPFAPEAVKFKVQTVFSGNSGCLVVAYIDARLVIERLNAVCPHLWEPSFSETPKDKLLLCRLTIDGVTREDVGESPKGLSKDLYSDALKRAAVHFGVGVSIYALPQIPLYMRDAKNRIELRGKAPKETIALTEHGHKKLREGYATWLEEHGIRNFGSVLAHGDVEGATIDEETEAGGEAFAPEAPAALDDDRAKELIGQARGLYRQIAEIDGAQKAFPPERFNAWLTGSWHSHAELERFVAYLQDRQHELGQAASS